MLKRSVFVIISLFTASALLAQAYKWTDEDGVVHYSDRPHEGAVEMQLPDDGIRPPGVSTLPVQTVFRANNDEEGEAVEIFRYANLAIESPAVEETLWNIGGVLNVRLNVRPAVQSGHTLNVYYDGTAITVNTPQFQIEEVYRGAHNLQAEILDDTGRLLIRSQNTRFYVQQTSIATPPR